MFLKAIKYVVYTWVLITLVALFDPLQLQPTSYSIDLPEKFEGVLAPNSRLNEAKRLFLDKVKGTESLALYKDDIYTGTEQGVIVKISPGDRIQHIYKIGDDCSEEPIKPDCSRPLGLRFDSKGKLWIADAFKGLLTLDIQTEKVTVVIPYDQIVNGMPIKFPDDLDIDEKAGIVYMSDLSTKWTMKNFSYSLLEHDCSGRIIQYTIATKAVSILKGDLCQPNGVQISSKGDFLIVSEFSNMRLMKIHLQGAKKGQMEVFAGPMPGSVDNVRITSRGTYWAAIMSGLNSTSASKLKFLASSPMIVKVTASVSHVIGCILECLNKYLFANPSISYYAIALKDGWILLDIIPNYGMVVEIDANGNILRSLQSPDGSCMYLSEVLETKEGYLYLGSFINNYLGKLKL